MDYHSLVEKTTTLRGRLTSKMGSKEVGDEATIQTSTSSLSLSGLKERLNGLMNRQGSGSEIGWAMDSVDDSVQDETELFYSLFEQLKTQNTCNEQMLDHSYLLVPGLFCNSYPTYFREILDYFNDTLGVQCEFAHINTEGAVKDNATHIRNIVLEQYAKFGKTVVLLGHSKGGTDASAACAMYWNELKDKVRGLILLQAPYGGTPLAADLLGGGQFGALNSVFLGKLASFSNPDGTVDAVKDLTYKNRRAFLDMYPLPPDSLFPLQLPPGLHPALQEVHDEGEFPERPSGGAAGDAAGQAAGLDVQVHFVALPGRGERRAGDAEGRRGPGRSGGEIQGGFGPHAGHPGGFPGRVFPQKSGGAWRGGAAADTVECHVRVPGLCYAPPFHQKMTRPWPAFASPVLHFFFFFFLEGGGAHVPDCRMHVTKLERGVTRLILLRHSYSAFLYIMMMF